ncbi:MAG: phosphoenolpyruvate--protein phosphotransferase, partial [Phycisphaeraceae bacterium]|nr:phosphoenolpyruvate--protein phosphotransferase [Phycisphaeraceae bacterium]
MAITRAVVLDAVDQPIPRRLVPAEKTAEQHERLTAALNASAKDVEDLTARTAAEIGPEMAKIFDFHLAMLRDPQLVGQFEQMIDRERVTAEYAVYAAMRGLAAQFMAFENPYFHDRVKDVWDLERRILRNLLGGEGPDLSQIRHEAALIAHDLTPSQTASLDKTMIKGLATDAGGRTSHTAILAHALGIPAIVGLEDITAHISSGDTVIIDGNRGQVIVNPDAAQLLEYRQFIEQIAKFETSLGQVARQPAITTDGTEITLLANIEFPSEIKPAIEKGAVGVGLYRTEFLFLASEIEPSEQQQLDAYLQAIEAAAGRPLTIRTLDLGADKIHHHSVNFHAENNPFLGCRSIRLCLQNLSLFKTQLRAILRASAHGPIRIMFPLISNLMELRQAKMILSDVMEDL